MKAIGYYTNLPIDQADALVDLDLPEPEPGPHDLLVDVHAVSVNPVDTKLRRNAAPADGQPRVLGFDAAGLSACGRRRGQPVQARRPRLVRRLHRPRRLQCAAATRRRTHRRPHAGDPGFRPGSCAATDRDHCLGTAVRPTAGAPRQRRRKPAGDRCRGRRGLHSRAARAAPDRPACDRHGVARRNTQLGRVARRA